MGNVTSTGVSSPLNTNSSNGGGFGKPYSGVSPDGSLPTTNLPSANGFGSMLGNNMPFGMMGGAPGTAALGGGQVSPPTQGGSNSIFQSVAQPGSLGAPAQPLSTPTGSGSGKPYNGAQTFTSSGGSGGGKPY